MRILAFFTGLFLCFSSFAIELDESSPVPGEWGYRPDEGASVGLNPPGFSWRPCDGAEGYILEVAADPDFSTLLYSSENLKWSAHCPPRAFPPGTYHWRYAAVDKAGEKTRWSRVRKFEVPPDAVEMPQPTRAELRERMPAEHPRLFMRPADVAELRKLAKGPLADIWEGIEAAADNALKSPPDTSEPPTYPKGITKSGTPDKWRKIWWGNRGRVINVADTAATLGFAYRISGKEEYARAAKDLVVAMTKWDPQGSTKWTYNDEAAMPALYQTSRAYTWAYPAFSEPEREAAVAMMRERGNQAYEHLLRRQHLWHPYASHSNRAWHFLGEAAIAFYGEFPEAVDWLDFAMTVHHTAYPVWGRDSGGWHEGVAYWSSYISRFMHWAFVVEPAFGIDVFKNPFFNQTGYFGLYSLPPGTKGGSPFADQGIRSKPSSIAPLMNILASGAGNPYWKWYAEKCGAEFRGYLGFLFAAKSRGVQPQPPTDLPTSRVFEDVGIAVMNTNLVDGEKNIQLVFKSSPWGRQSHGYNSNNAFALSIGGKRALISSGARDLHGSVHHREWMWETKSDNAILVNGGGQFKHTAGAKGCILEFTASPEKDIVVGEAGDSYADLKSWTRRIEFDKPGAILIRDVLEAHKPSTFTWLLHAIDAPFEIKGQTAIWNGPQGKIRIEFIEPAGLEITQTDKMDPPPADWAGFEWKEFHLKAHAGEKVERREFVTKITVEPDWAE